MITEQVRLRLITHNARLVGARKAKNWTQEEFCMLVGIDINKLHKIETLKEIPSEEVRDEMAAALNVSVEYLFPNSLIEALKDGLFDNRVAVLDEAQVVRLTEARRAGLLPSPLTNYSIDDIENRINNDAAKVAIKNVLPTLSIREQRILTLRFGLDGVSPKTLKQVGIIFGFTKERVRQIEAKALRRLRHPCRSQKLKGYV